MVWEVELIRDWWFNFITALLTVALLPLFVSLCVVVAAGYMVERITKGRKIHERD
jgi:hypothetical protein